MRWEPTTNSPIVAAIPHNGFGITFECETARDGKWLLVAYKNAAGWVFGHIVPESATPRGGIE